MNCTNRICNFTMVGSILHALVYGMHYVVCIEIPHNHMAMLHDNVVCLFDYVVCLFDYVVCLFDYVVCLLTM